MWWHKPLIPELERKRELTARWGSRTPRATQYKPHSNRPEGKSNTQIPAELRDRVLQSWIWGNGRQAFTSLVGRGIGFRSPQHCLWSWILLAKLTAASQLLSLYISHCFEYTNVLALLNIMVALGRQVLLFIFYRWDNQNAKLLSKLSKIISPIG